MTKQESIDYSGTAPKPVKATRRNALDDLAADGLKRVREKSGLTRKELAEKIGITPQMMSRYEKTTDDKDPSKVTLAIAYAVSSKLGVKIEEFFATAPDNMDQYALSDNQQAIIKDYSSYSESQTDDLKRMKDVYLSIKSPEKREEFINLLENVAKTYQD